jgi:hypothetical protein
MRKEALRKEERRLTAITAGVTKAVMTAREIKDPNYILKLLLCF